MSQTSIELSPVGIHNAETLRQSSTTANHGPSGSDPIGGAVNENVVPDGGYGWTVIFACATITFWFVGTTYSWGVIQAALVGGGLANASTLSFVGSLTVACIAIFAIANAKLVSLMGARKSGLIGISLLGLGELLGSLTTENVGGLFATVGVLEGIGASICFMTVSVVPSQWFSRKRGLANGIVFAGGGLGGAAISISMDQLVQNLGPAWTLRIIGLLTLATGLPAAMLIKERSPPQRTTFVQWSLFRSLRFSLLFFAGVIATFPLFVPPFFLPLYCESIGLRPSTGAAVVAVFNFSSAIGRIGLGLLCDYAGPLNVLCASLLFGGISMLGLWPFSGTLAPLIVFAIWNGIANGGFFAVIPTVVGSVFGAEKVPLTMGMIVSGWAGGYLMGGPIAGYILNAYLGRRGGIDAYKPAMYYAGSMSIGAATLVALMRFRVNGRLLTRV